MAILRHPSSPPQSRNGSASSKKTGSKKLLRRIKSRSSSNASSKQQRKDSCSDNDYDEPPLLNILVDYSQDHVNFPVHRRSASAISREFAIAAKDAVQVQLESRECSTCEGGGGGEKLHPSSSPSAHHHLRLLKATTHDALDVFRKGKVREILFDEELPYEGETVRTKDLAERHSGEHGYLMFVIRRPGCKLCREQALYLKYLFENYPNETKGFSVIGIVKDFCDNGESLLDFYKNYFPFPLYLDDQMTLYEGLGNRKVSMSATLKLLNPFSDVSKRLKKNKIQGNFTGEGFVQGGVIVFRNDGEPAYKYEEETGFELPVSDIATALEKVRCTAEPSHTCSSIGSSSLTSKHLREEES